MNAGRSASYITKKLDKFQRTDIFKEITTMRDAEELHENLANLAAYAADNYINAFLNATAMVNILKKQNEEQNESNAANPEDAVEVVEGQRLVINLDSDEE